MNRLDDCFDLVCVDFLQLVWFQRYRHHILRFQLTHSREMTLILKTEHLSRNSRNLSSGFTLIFRPFSYADNRGRCDRRDLKKIITSMIFLILNIEIIIKIYIISLKYTKNYDFNIFLKFFAYKYKKYYEFSNLFVRGHFRCSTFRNISLM